MSERPEDIYTEPEEVDPDTLANLGPLRPLAGVWEGAKGRDEHPVADGAEEDAYIRDRNTLTKIGEPTPNPLMRG